MRRIRTAGITALLMVAGLAAGIPPAAAATDTEIVVLGGTDAIGDAVLEHLGSCSTQPVQRISGGNRYATAAEISSDVIDASDEVFVATADDFPDGVAAGSPAALAGAPVLLTDPDFLPFATRAEIDRLGATQVYILGGAQAVSESVEGALEAFGPVTRLSGPNRYATAAAISQERFAAADTVYIATGNDFPDALAGAPAAAADDAPILLVTRTSIPDPTRSELERLDPDTTIVLGGTAVISDAVASELPGTVVRLAGSNRFATAAAISQATFDPADTSVIYLTTGLDFPDALAGGPAAGHENGPMLLATENSLPAATAAEIARLTGLPCGEFHEPTGSGLEPGTVLAGHILPLNWSERAQVCGDQETVRLGAWESEGGGPALCPGDASSAVTDLQRLLRDKRLFRGPLTGVYDRQTVYAVAAFHKLLGPAHRDPATARIEWLADPPPEDWSPDDWDLLEAFRPRPPKEREGQPNRVEIDIGRQVLYLIEFDEVAAIIPVSTGAGTGTKGCTYVGCGASVTPRTDRIPGGSTFYTQHNYVGGWSPRPGDWAIYKAIFYLGNYGEWNYGIHGYNQVPHYPASHGCIRTTVWDMDFLRPTGGPARVWLGQTIHVWDA